MFWTARAGFFASSSRWGRRMARPCWILFLVVVAGDVCACNVDDFPPGPPCTTSHRENGEDVADCDDGTHLVFSGSPLAEFTHFGGWCSVDRIDAGITYVCDDGISFTAQDAPSCTIDQRCDGGSEVVCERGELLAWRGRRFCSVTVGGSFACGISASGMARCWGWNTYGHASPPDIRLREVAAGGAACGLAMDDTIVCWGDSDYGAANPPAGEFETVTLSGSHGCAVANDGSAVCWGSDKYGESSPPGDSFAGLSAGGSFTCGTTTLGAIRCWGDDGLVPLFGYSGEHSQVVSGNRHTCALSTTGTVTCFGNRMTSPTGTFKQLATGIGMNIACGIREDGTLSCWGSDQDSPDRDILTPPEGIFIDVSLGHLSACGVTVDGAVLCWGEEIDGF